MRYLKQMLCLLLSIVMVLGMLAGCSNAESEQESTPPTQSTEPTSTTEPAPDYNRLVDVSGEEARTAVLADDTLELAL